jgi:OOP family OmpA-OmpF porin
MSSRVRRLLLLLVAAALTAAPALAIGPGDLKKKAEKKAKEAAEKKAKEKTDEAVEAPDASNDPPADEAEEKGGAPGGKGAASGDGGSVASVSTKFDFVPGGKVLLMDDFTRDELGEFPARWKLLIGNFDVVDYKGKRWMRLNGGDGTVALKTESLPEKWTLEFDIDQEEITGPTFTVSGLADLSRGSTWYVTIGNSGKAVAFAGPESMHSTADFPGGPLTGPHHVALMANGSSLKVYVDRERLVNIPEMNWGEWAPKHLSIRLWRYGDDPRIANVRFAEGGKEKVDLLATPFVTHGIYFDSGSDRLKPESAPVLRQIGGYLKENAEVAIVITGHTDSDGADAANQSLSEKRATAVAAALTADFGIDAARMKAAGKGESAPLAPNDSPEGKAMNRRVEFSKQ